MKDEIHLFTLITNYEGICFDTITTNLLINETPHVEPLVTDIDCNGNNIGVIQLFGTNVFSSSIFSDCLEQEGINIFEGLCPAEYTVFVSSMEGCDTTFEVSIFEPEVFFVDIVKDTITIFPGQEVVIETIKNDSTAILVWTPNIRILDIDSFEPTALPNESMTYLVTAINQNGCIATDDVFIRVLKDRKIFIPNAFTPNGDGFNDIFFIYSEVAVKQIKSF